MRQFREDLLQAHKHPFVIRQMTHEDMPAVIALERPGAVGLELDLAPVAQRVGATIGRYKFLERIGEGGFGIVYMAEQLTPVRRKVALKVIKPGCDTRQVIARFEAERQVLALGNGNPLTPNQWASPVPEPTALAAVGFAISTSPSA